MPSIAKSKSHSSLVGIVIFVLLIIMLIEELITDRILFIQSCQFVLLTQLKP